MKRLPYGLRLVWLNVGYYGGLLCMTLVGLCVVSVPAYFWIRRRRGYDRGEAVRWLIWIYGRAWTKLLAFFVPVRLVDCDRQAPKPCIIAPNHQSFFDAYCFAFMPEHDVVFAVRSWPFRIPFYRPYMQAAGYLDTENLNSLELLGTARAVLDKGTCIAVFPEGTRSPDGRLGRFHAGAFHLAVAAGVPVVPLCIDGTGAFLRKGGFLLRPATVTVRMLEPVWPEQFAQSGDEAPLLLRRTVKARIQQALQELRGEQPARADAHFSTSTFSNHEEHDL